MSNNRPAPTFVIKASVIGNVFEIDALHQVRPQIDQDDDRPYGYFDLKEDMDELIVSRPAY